ncbi:hypothetical protein BVX98_05125 [bacterium F11]|nr:hypothetical protein BVX98_05125 [bacterium F11]
MNYFALSGLVNGVVSTVCGAIIYFQDPKGKKNRLFALYCVSLAVWGYGYFVWQLCQRPGSALFFSRALMVGAIFIPVFHYHHFLSMFDLETPGRRWILRICYVLSFIFLISNFTPWFISGVEQRSIFEFWPVPGPLFHPYLIMLAILITSSLMLFSEFKVKTSPVIRNGLAWVSAATVIGWGGGATNFLLWYNIPFPPWPNVIVSIYIGINTMMFFKLGLFDIKLFFRDTTVHILTSFLVGGIYTAIIFPVLQSYLAIFFILLIVVILPIVYQPVYRWVRENINRTRLGRVDQYLDLAKESMDKIRETTYTYDDLARNIVDSVLNTFPVGMAAVYFLDLETRQLHLRAQIGMKNSLANDLKYNRNSLAITDQDPLIRYMAGRKNVVVREEIKVSPKRRDLDTSVESSLERIEAEICAPFLFAGSVKGVLVLGRKKGNQLFHEQDLKAIYSFGRMGEEIMRYIMGMEHEVRNTALYSHDMNNDTKSLLQFLHFLLSPQSEKSPKDKIHGLLKQSADIMARLNQTFQLNRDRSTLILRSIKGEYDMEPVDVVSLCRESMSKVKAKMKQSSVEFSLNLPIQAVIVKGNSYDLIRVLDNLLNNALRYVKPGGKIDVSGKVNDGVFETVVCDDGEGIEPADLERIWNFGWQAKDSTQGASGLGLSIARQIVYLHGGKIWVESEGKGKGTKFIYIIPTIEEDRGNLVPNLKKEMG